MTDSRLHPAANEPFLKNFRDIEVTPSSISTEKSKAALTRKLSFVEILMHSVALGTIAVIYYFNKNSYFWEDVTDAGTTFQAYLHLTQSSILKAWQFVAKLHELTMQGSLSALVFYYAHQLLVSSKGIPFGLMDAPYNSGSLAMLLHRRFWTTGFGLGWRTILFALFLLVICVLSASVGPSSAILMIPSLNWWPNKNPFDGQEMATYFWPSNSSFWSSTFDLSSFDQRIVSSEACCQTNPSEGPANLGCPLQGFSDYVDWFIGYSLGGGSNNLTITETLSNTQRSIATAVEIETYTKDLDPNGRNATSSFTTSLTDRITLCLGAFWNYVKRSNVGVISQMSRPRLIVQSGIHTYQPIVHVVCQSYLADETPFDVPFPILKNAWNPGNYINESWKVNASSDLFVGLPSTSVRFSWFKDIRSNSSTSLLALAIVPVNIRYSSGEADDQASCIVPCSIDARWAASLATYQPTDSRTVATNLTNPMLLNSRNLFSPEQTQDIYGISKSPIDLSMGWAQLLDYSDSNWTDLANLSLTGQNTNASSTMTSLLSIPVVPDNSTTKPTNGTILTWAVRNRTSTDFVGGIEEAIATLIGIVITDAIARTSYWFPIPVLDVQQNRTSEDLISLGTFLVTGPAYGDEAAKTAIKQSSGLVLRYDVERYGYGYGLNSRASQAALGVLLLYSALVVLYLLYVGYLLVLGRYWRTIAWGEMQGILAIAMNSSPTETLYGTSAGVEERETWDLIVRVKEVGVEHLELVFGDRNRVEGAVVNVEKKYL